MARGKPASPTIPISTPWKEKFRSNTTRTNFVLTLTKPMMEFLSAVADGVQWDRSLFGNIYNPDNWIASEHALTNRGLIERKSDLDSRSELDNALSASEYSRGMHQFCKLTPAGEAVVELLKVAGLFIESDAGLRKRSKKA